MTQEAIQALIKTCTMLNDRIEELEKELEMLKQALLDTSDPEFGRYK
jgi:prefoldin subunit 5